MDVYWASVIFQGLPRWLSGKESTCNAGDGGLIPRCGRSSGKGNGNPLQYSCLGNSTDRGAWWATVHGVAKSRPRLSDWAHTSSFRRYTHGLSAIPHGTPDRKLKFTEVYLVSLRLHVCEPWSWESCSGFTQSPRWPWGVPAAPLVSAPCPSWPCSVWRGSASLSHTLKAATSVTPACPAGLGGPQASTCTRNTRSLLQGTTQHKDNDARCLPTPHL